MDGLNDLIISSLINEYVIGWNLHLLFELLLPVDVGYITYISLSIYRQVRYYLKNRIYYIKLGYYLLSSMHENLGHYAIMGFWNKL